MKRLPPLSTLPVLEAAARLQSFSAAAEELNVTHGAVSHQMRSLEEHLGLALFARQGRRVVLTPEGAELVEPFEAARLLRPSNAGGSIDQGEKSGIVALPP